MLQMAQDMLKVVQDRVRNTLHAMADFAESVGVPPTVTSLIHNLTGNGSEEVPTYTPPPRPVSTPDLKVAQPEILDEPRKPTKKRAGSRDLPDGIRPLGVDDAINGSTYLARIIWSLGVAELEGTGALRPADMARMIMSRSPISLEPPNVARYIRRSKPTSIAIDRTEGSSSFYKLSAEGKALFEEKFRE
jgi:hypothetical protein